MLDGEGAALKGCGRFIEGGEEELKRDEECCCEGDEDERVGEVGDAAWGGFFHVFLSQCVRALRGQSPFHWKASGWGRPMWARTR